MPHDAFILAAGLGTRLRPLTRHRPKPLVPVCGVPMLDQALALCRAHGLDEVVVNAHHLAHRVHAWAADHEGVRVSEEQPEILGTGGGLAAVADQLAERFAVVNADVLCDVDLAALVETVPAGGAAMALRPHAEDADRYGIVAADTTGTVVRLSSVAEATPQGATALDTHFTGIHAMHRDTLALVPKGFACIVRTAYADLVPRRLVGSLRHEGTWLDVGDPVAYLAANLALLTTTLAVPLDPFRHAAFAVGPRGDVAEPPPHVSVEGSCWVGPGARLGRGVVLRDAIVGPGAEVASGTVLERTVVWDGVQVPSGHWRDGIAYDGGWLAVHPSPETP